MDRDQTPQGNFALALIFFVLIAATCVVLLITALVVWLSALTGSLIASTLIVSGICLVSALAIYLLALRAPLARIRDQIETIYDVARAARQGYEWIADRISVLLKLREIYHDLFCEK